ncbi:glycosyltransferase family 39 protein [Cryobacterium sp. SO2]|uniref:glycosyltransferase family 39 protein n=1 Tax=Cryobacterium sp. SO2 TaxID=1897060 RepID=UPI00223E5E18|nr:glycosyltransferase family 39 protein [Cryobacterium sp. SO2]WEO78410.1 glycosyltransferase family 39 protein [Cryobacterium sp. SO2]
MTTLLASPLVEAARPATWRARGFTGTAALLGLAGFAVSVAGSWRPSYWGDEAASVLSAERSLPSLFRLLGNIDAVHGTYYLFLHAWIDTFGASEFATRLPSALAIGAATAGTAVLARMLVNTRVAVIAALVFAVLPRVTYMGAETRSTALATMLAVWTTVLLVHIVRSPTVAPPWRLALWAAYALLLAAGIYLFLYSALLLPVHALVVVLLSRRRRSDLPAWAGSGAVALLLAAPVIYWAVRERGQISFLARRAQVEVLDAAVRQWFGTPTLAVAAWALIGIGCLAAFVPRFRSSGPAPRAALVVFLAWAIVPSAALLIGSHLITPMYSLRYLSICTPAAAILVAMGIGALAPRWAQAVALLLVLGLAAPGYLGQRTDFAKDGGSDWRQVSEILHAEARPRDAVVFDGSTKPSARPRLAMHLYPAGFVGLNDIALDQPYQNVDWLWDTTVPLADATSRLAGTNRVWVLQNVGSRETVAGTDVSTLQQLGFTVASARTVNRTIIIELTR